MGEWGVQRGKGLHYYFHQQAFSEHRNPGGWEHSCEEADLASAHMVLAIWGLRHDGKGQY